jgi:hypothetical protein
MKFNLKNRPKCSTWFEGFKKEIDAMIKEHQDDIDFIKETQDEDENADWLLSDRNVIKILKEILGEA